MTVKSKSIWLSYDFGLKGNYAGLFAFLDNYKATDCGNGLAFFNYPNEKHLDSAGIIEKLKLELVETVAPSHSDRIYVIWRNDEGSTTKVKGKFLFGDRKTPAWNGYATKGRNNSEEEAI